WRGRKKYPPRFLPLASKTKGDRSENRSPIPTEPAQGPARGQWLRTIPGRLPSQLQGSDPPLTVATGDTKKCIVERRHHCSGGSNVFLLGSGPKPVQIFDTAKETL